MNSLLNVLARLPLWFVHAVGWVLGWLAFAWSPTYRRRFLSNARQAGYPFAQVMAAVGAAGGLVAELPRLWHGALPPVRWLNGEVLERAVAQGKGVLFLTPHLGCFEVVAQSFGDQYSHRFGPVTVLYRPARQAWLAQWMRVARDKPGLKAVPTALVGVRHLIKALRAGQCVGLLPDQVPPEGQGEWTPFFEQPAYTMTLAARLANQTGATVVLAWGERLPRGQGYAVHLSALAAPLSANATTAVNQLNAEMEGLIRQCPSQYLWGYARYKKPRPGSIPEVSS
jgi:Kdo2-lipid IVA lauroyltransferase/acyltransferase